MTDYHDTLKDVFSVGKVKPLGFVLRGAIKAIGQDEKVIAAELTRCGLNIALFDEKDCHGYTGALYAWDKATLTALLKRHESTLHGTGWPVEPGSFVRRLANRWVPEKTKLYDVVADAFGNKNDPRRSDVAIPADTRDPFLQRLQRGCNPFVPSLDL